MHVHDNILVKDLMMTTVRIVSQTSTIHQAVENMLKWNIGSLIVVREHADTSTISRSDILGLAPIYSTISYLLSAHQGKNTSITTAMHTEYITVFEDEPLSSAIRGVVNNKTWRMIVHNAQDEVVGILSATDIIRFLNQQATNNS